MNITIARNCLAVLMAVTAIGTANADSSKSVLKVAITGNPGGGSVGPAIAGITSSFCRWALDEGRAKLDTDGNLKVKVRGLLVTDFERVGPFPDDCTARTGNSGRVRQPVMNLFASLVCNGQVIANTASVSFSEDGDADINENILAQLQGPPDLDNCINPSVVLRADPQLRAIAQTGFAITD